MLSYPAMATDSLHDHKMRFAELLQRVAKERRLQSAVVAAKQVVGKDADKFPMYVIQISEEWPFDPEVVAEIDRLDLVPIPKELVLKDVYALASDPYKEAKDKIAAYRLYCEMNGWIAKSTTKEATNSNELLSHLQALHNAVQNPIDT